MTPIGIAPPGEALGAEAGAGRNQRAASGEPSDGAADSTPEAATTNGRRAAVAYARRRWSELGAALASVTPGLLARLLLVAGALAAGAWLLARTWGALVPFEIGAVLAYLLLPLVDRLARRMPRGAAVAIVFAGGLAVLVALLTSVLPPLVAQLAGLAGSMPSGDDINRVFTDLEAFVQTLTPEQQAAVADVADRVVAALRDNASRLLQGAAEVVVGAVFSVANFLSFVAGFLVVPFWLIYVLADQPRGRRALDRALPAWLRADFWAVVRIADRAFGGYARGVLVLGVFVGAATYLGLYALEWLGIANVPYRLLLAVVAGVCELIPFFGGYLALVPAVLVAASGGWQTVLAVFLLYWVIEQLENHILVPRVTGEAVNIHPAVLMVVLIALAQLGLVWIILGAPLAALVRDLYRYAYGRLSEPPRPAGLLPGEPARLPQAAP